MTLVKTNIYERPFNPLLGSRINKILFENFDAGLSSTLEEEIRVLITNFEPRIILNSVDAIDDIDNNSISITINYTIIGQPLNPQSLNILLARSF